MKLDIKTIEALVAADIGFMGHIRTAAGGTGVMVSPGSLELYVTDRDAFAAARFGGTVDEYRRWLACDGTPYCGATTGKGSRCRNEISGGGQRSFQQWLDLDGTYCAVHGGEGAAEAALSRRKGPR